jgi:hypothetical protein
MDYPIYPIELPKVTLRDRQSESFHECQKNLSR